MRIQKLRDSSGEFETCPDWVPILDSLVGFRRNSQLERGLSWFEQGGIYAAKVLNASKMGSQITILLTLPHSLPASAEPADSSKLGSSLRVRRPRVACPVRRSSIIPPQTEYPLKVPAFPAQKSATLLVPG